MIHWIESFSKILNNYTCDVTEPANSQAFGVSTGLPIRQDIGGGDLRLLYLNSTKD